MYEDDYRYMADISYSNINPAVLYPDGCDYHKEAVVCPPNKRYEGQCETCGWNPRVARRRSYLIRKMFEEEANGSD